MRITNKVIKQDYLNNLSTNLESMNTYEQQLSSGHQINKPSDDPFKATRTMELLSDITANERYKANIEEGIGWLSTVDTALDQMGEVLHTVREKTIAGGNAAYGTGERKAIKDHIIELRGQLMQIANTAYDGRYVFGGDRTTEPPFNLGTTNTAATDSNGNFLKTVEYSGSDIGLNREMSQGVIIDISTKGSEFKDLFSTIDQIIVSLDDPTKNPADNLDILDKGKDKLLSLRSEEGAYYKRLEDMNNKNDSETFNMTELLSKTYDIDVAKKYMEFKVMESVYQASLMIGPKILQPSMLDYMR